MFLSLAFLSYPFHKVGETSMICYLWLTDLNANRDHLLPSLKLLGTSVPDLSVEKGVRDQRNLWPWLETLLSILIGIIYSSRTLPTQFEGSQSKSKKINRDHVLINDYLPTKFEASKAKCSWVIGCTRLRETDIPTDVCK